MPARGGSKRLPNKNILLLNDIPLLAHSIRYAQQNKAIIDEVFVSTDDAAIKEIAMQYGAKVIDRPEAISGDFEPTVSAMKHAVQSLNKEVENVILLQPTNPLRPENLLANCFEKFSTTGADSLFTVSRNHHKLGKIVDNTFIPFNYTIGQRSQDLEPLYYENGLLYISKAELILNDQIISNNVIPYQMSDSFPIVDIDTPEDFEYAAYLITKKTTENKP
ncbi:cytidylyltransferase domain-containing protein [Flavobacterium sp. XGLA_31]|uniref:acylneuraminate cytidylyltransferase family protein n=1 Tax=Flavobacterium sp. XGLA_31 TaxID=3447666 RepID=UPI003F392B50